MNKLEKILAQSVTPEMVSEHLTEQEIEEVIEEYETKIANAEDDIESSTERRERAVAKVPKFIFEVEMERERAERERAKCSLKIAEDCKHFIENEVEKVEVWRSVVSKAKQALKGKETSPNERRAKLIEEAKEYIKDNKYGLEAKLDRADRKVTVHDHGTVNKKYIYPPHLTWNKYIAKAWGMAKFNTDDELIYKFGGGASQPTEIIRGMDVELSGLSGKFYASGRTISYCEERDAVTFSSIYETGENVHIYSGEEIAGVRTDGFKITGDTKANYEEDKK